MSTQHLLATSHCVWKEWTGVHFYTSFTALYTNVDVLRKFSSAFVSLSKRASILICSLWGRALVFNATIFQLFREVSFIGEESRVPGENH